MEERDAKFLTFELEASFKSHRFQVTQSSRGLTESGRARRASPSSPKEIYDIEIHDIEIYEIAYDETAIG